MVGAISGTGVQAYTKIQQTSGQFRNPAVDGTAVNDVLAANRKDKVNTAQISRTAEASSTIRGNAPDKEDSADRFSSNESLENEAVRGSLLDISV